MKAGFIGTGRMGVGMAANLLKAGHALTVYNRTQARTSILVEQGAQLARNIADACHEDFVISMLSNDEAVERVALGEGGIVATLGRDATHICCSTISVALSQRLSEAHARAGQHFVAAPVFGRPDAASAAKLSFVVAGTPAAVDSARPLFEAMGQQVFEVSEQSPKANLIKLCGNLMIASVIESLGETMALVSKDGIEPRQFLDIMTSTLFSAPVCKNYGGMIADGKFQPAGFAAPLGQKDIRLTLAAAEALQVPLPLASLLRDRFLALLAQGGEELDWSAIAKLAAEDAGL